MVIIIIVLSVISLANQNEVNCRRAKKASSVQYIYRKCGTHARRFPKHLRMDMARLKEDKEREREREREEEECENNNKFTKTEITVFKKSQYLAMYSSGLPTPGVATKAPDKFPD